MTPAGRRRTKLALVVLVALLAFDLSRAPADQWSARLALGAIGRYQAWVSPWLGRAGVACRFRPSCSHFAQGAIRKDGALVGGARALWRVLRCGPWTPAGTLDPP